MRLSILTAITSLTFLATTAIAQVTFGDLKHKGSGCPLGSTALSPSPDSSSVSILFDAFQVQVPNETNEANDNELGRRRGRNDVSLQHKACALSFVATLPEGQQVETIELSIYNRGSTFLDQGVQGSLSTIFVGYEGLNNGARPRPTIVERKLWQTRRQGIDEDWTSNPVITIPIQSSCASRTNRNVRFDLKNHLEAEIMNGDVSRSGLVTMDSSDVNGSLKIRVITRPCGSRTTPRVP